jgi:KaiB-like protein
VLSSKTSKGGSSGSIGSNGEHDCPDPIELILYVSEHSPQSANALDQIKSVLGRYKSQRVTLTICDLSKDLDGGSADGIAFMPTLVNRSPGPRTFILGHITNPELLLEMLEACDET